MLLNQLNPVCETSILQSDASDLDKAAYFLAHVLFCFFCFCFCFSLFLFLSFFFSFSSYFLFSPFRQRRWAVEFFFNQKIFLQVRVIFFMIHLFFVLFFVFWFYFCYCLLLCLFNRNSPLSLTNFIPTILGRTKLNMGFLANLLDRHVQMQSISDMEKVNEAIELEKSVKEKMAQQVTVFLGVFVLIILLFWNRIGCFESKLTK